MGELNHVIALKSLITLPQRGGSNYRLGAGQRRCRSRPQDILAHRDFPFSRLELHPSPLHLVSLDDVLSLKIGPCPVGIMCYPSNNDPGINSAPHSTNLA